MFGLGVRLENSRRTGTLRLVGAAVVLLGFGVGACGSAEDGGLTGNGSGGSSANGGSGGDASCEGLSCYEECLCLGGTPGPCLDSCASGQGGSGAGSQGDRRKTASAVPVDFAGAFDEMRAGP